MSRLATLAARAIHQPITTVIYNQLKANVDYATVAGANVASATTLAITSSIHLVTGTTTIDNISDALGAVAGQRVRLIFQATATVRHNGGGTGNIRLVAGLHATFVANETLELTFDGTNWIEAHRSPKHVTGEEVTLSHVGQVSGGGYLIEDGSAILRTTYAALFAHQGTTHGAGDGSTTFNLADKRGRMTVGHAASGHANVATVGGNEGIVSASFALRRPQHRTSMVDPTHGHTSSVLSVSNGTGPGNLGRFAAADTSGAGGSAVPPTINAAATGITVGTNNANDPLDAPAYIVKPVYVRI